MIGFCLDKTRRFHVHSVRSGGRDGSRLLTLCEEHCTSTSEVRITASRIEKRKRETQQPKPRPNFFVGVKLDGLEEKVIEIQNKIRQECEPLNVSKTFTSSKKMHLTAFVLTLTKEQVPLAAEVFLACQQELIAPTTITLGNCQRIGNKVVYVAPKTEDIGFQSLGNVLRVIYERFTPFFDDQEENKVYLTPDKWYQQWLPHATIAKTSADQKNGRRIKFHHEHIANCETEFLDMEIPLNRLDLLEMAKVDENGYYKSVATIRFPSSSV